MTRALYLTVWGVGGLCALLVAIGRAQVYPVHQGQERVEPQPAASVPPSLVLADGGIEFPDGSVQTTAALGGSPAPVPRTGQSVTFSPGDDGDLQLGVTWPNPRFTDHGNGTVTDNLTGLIWLDDANCFGEQTYGDALAKAAALFDGCGDCGGADDDCGLTDGSVAGQWRLPNVRELHSLLHYGVHSPPFVPNTAGTGKWSEGDPFSDVQTRMYWSSTADLFSVSDVVWGVDFGLGGIGDVQTHWEFTHVWLVTGGQ